MSNDKIERRILAGKLTLRSAGGDGPGFLEGYAATYNSRSKDLGGFVEQLRTGAFDKVVKSADLDCRFLVNHDPNQILGRTKAKTLTLRSDNTGLWCSVQLPNTQLGRDIHESVARGDIDQMSFAFKLNDGDEDWADETDSRTGARQKVRTISNVSYLFDVSSVVYPAYESTSVSARNLAAHYHIATPPAPPVVLMTERERAEARGQRIAREDHDAYLADVAESNRPRTIDPFMDAVRKEQIRANRK